MVIQNCKSSAGIRILCQQPHQLNGIAFLFAFFIIMTTAPVEAVPNARISDIIGNPVRYRDVRVKVQGQVTKVTPDPYTPNGVYYTLQDTDGQVIRIRSLVAPEIDARILVVGIVAQDNPSSKPYIVEIKHILAGIPVSVLVSAGAILALLAVLLSYKVFVPGYPKQKAQFVKNGVQAASRPVITQVFRDNPVAVLVAMAGPHKGEIYKIYSGINTIGRDDNQTVQLSEDTTVSRSHAWINADDGCIKIINQSITNPTRISGQEISESELNDGDIIQIGSTRLRVTIIGNQ